jgi:hypothetical protein
VDEGLSLSNGPTCFPLFAVLQLQTPRDTEVINVSGVACETKGPVDNFNLSGGFGIIESAVGVGAWGTVTGTWNLSTGKAVVTYSGTTLAALPPP